MAEEKYKATLMENRVVVCVSCATLKQVPLLLYNSIFNGIVLRNVGKKYRLVVGKIKFNICLIFWPKYPRKNDYL